jgi:hypothetical protein
VEAAAGQPPLSLCRLVISDGRRSQALTVAYPTNPPGVVLETIQWAGDLDGDGRPDLILTEGNNLVTRLWLSSMATDGELVHAAVEYLPEDFC